MLVLAAPDTRALTASLSRAAQEQVPFATAVALNDLARSVIAAETEGLTDTFNKPKRFTKGAFTQNPSFGGLTASKKLPVAIITAYPTQANYLAPSEQPKTVQYLGVHRKMRTPVRIKLNASGDIPRDKIAALLTRPDCFLAVVKGINGLWQRQKPVAKGRRRAKAGAGRSQVEQPGRLRLLVAFTRPVQVRTDMHFQSRAQSTVAANWNASFVRGMARALKSAK